MNKSLIFYTLFYKINSKFDINNYCIWFEKLLPSMKQHKFIIYTNKETYEFISHYKEQNPNIDFIIKEFEEFEFYKCKEIFEKNTDVILYPYHTISWLLLLLYVNRHIFVEELKEKYAFEYICYLDVGYFRNINNNDIIDINIDHLDKDKIYLGLIMNEKDYFNNICNVMKNFDKSLIKNIVVKNMCSIGGGAYIIPSSKIYLWTKTIKDVINKFINNDVYFKDDQIMLVKMFTEIKEDIILITDTSKEIEWFPFIKFLQKNEKHNIIFFSDD